ncbi:MAG: shikimate kinase [Candidatus Altiarchaeales archaeon]|nr:MAG: shikimate kinase [Candidatus Altiarchaeales archaeon]
MKFMKMRAMAISHGAATIVNAIATGKGAAFGISLETRATVELNETGKFSAKIRDFPDEDTKLMELCAKKVIDYFGLNYGADIETESNVPIATGLKSSSTAANSVVLATMSAIAKEHGEIKGKVDDLTLINLGVDAALEANVTVTGAFDDAAASYLGGFVVTDNKERKILRSGKMEPLDVLIFVPKEKIYTSKIDVNRTKLLSREVMIAWEEASKGNLYTAMTLNGLLYSATLGQDTGIPLAALGAGAISAGLSGTGPSVVALTKNNSEKIVEAWSEFDGKIIEAKVNNKKAEILE